ncbi:MAG: TonB-dependent receptor [bacterium]
MIRASSRITFLLLHLLPLLLAAQSVTGIIINESTHLPIAFVNVMVQKNADSTLVKGVVTNKAGKFIVENIPNGDCFLRISFIGYREKRIPVPNVTPERSTVNLGTIVLKETTVNLDEVLVTGQKALFNNAIDRKVFNVDQDIMSKSGSVSELLQTIPSVEVDIDGNVSLRGSSNVLVMIDGKTSPLMGRNRADVLQQMPASTIEKIEVITNPSAKYKPEGTSGIINLVLKKNSNLGAHGSTTVNAGNSDRYNGNVQFNYNPGNLNLFGSYGIRKENRNRSNIDTREQIDDSLQVHYYNQEQVSAARPLSHMITLGSDYKFDPSTNAGISGTYFLNSRNRMDNARTILWNNTRMETSNYTRNLSQDQFEREYSLTMRGEHKFPEEDHQLQVEYKASRQIDNEDDHFTTLYQVPRSPDQLENIFDKQDENQQELSLDYSNPLFDNSMLEAGYSGEFNRIALDYVQELFNPIQQKFLIDIGRSNRFILDQNIHAFYSTFQHSFGKFGILGGLRAERVTTTSNLVTRDSIINNSYNSLYPSLHLTYKFSEEAEVQLNYSRRTERPDAEELNPFPTYEDPRNISAGNPHLLPEYTHSLELGGMLQNDWMSILPTLYYRYTYNRFTSVTQALNDSTLLTTEQNLSEDQSAGMEVIVSASMNSRFTTHVSANAFYNQIDASNLGYSSNKSQVTWRGAFTFNINPTATTMIQLKANYNSARLTPQGERPSSYVVNAGVRQDLWEKTVSLVFTVADLFKTVKGENDTYTPFLRRHTVNKRDSQIFYFGLTYHFGTPPKKSNEELLKYDNSI